MIKQIQELFLDPTVQKLSVISLGIVVIWLIIKAAQRTIITKIKDNDSHYRAKKVSSFIGYFLSIILLLFVFGDNLGKFTVALGLAGAAIAFALQEIIASVAGWVAIMFGGFYKTGERVQLGGIKGDVMDIGILRTTIMEIGQWVDGDLYNGRIVFIANSFVFKGPVFNYSGDFPYLWDEIKIQIQYGGNYEKVKEILLNIGKEVSGDYTHDAEAKWNLLQNKYRLEYAPTEPMVSLIANENWVEFTLRYIVVFNKRRSTKSEMFSRILKAIDAAKGEVKFASSTPQFQVNINKEE